MNREILEKEWKLWRKSWNIDLRKINSVVDNYTLLALEKAFKEGYEKGISDGEELKNE